MPDEQPAVYNNSNDVNSGAEEASHRRDRGRPADGVQHHGRRRGAEQRRPSAGSRPIGGGDHFGMVFAKGNDLVTCVNKALSELKADGTLNQLQDKWISSVGAAPVLR